MRRSVIDWDAIRVSLEPYFARMTLEAFGEWSER